MPGSTHLFELGLQFFQGHGFAAYAEECPVFICTLAQDFAVFVNILAQLLGCPGQEQLELHEVLLEYRDDPVMQPGYVLRAAGAHDDAVRVLCAQRGCVFRLLCRVETVVYLVEYTQARHLVRTDFLEHDIRDFQLTLETGIA